MRASRGLTSGNGANNSSSRIFRRESTSSGSKNPTRSSSSKWQPAKKPLSPQYSNAKYAKSSQLNNRNIRRQNPKYNFFDTLNRFREKLVELLVNIQLKILDFILEPADKLFPNESQEKYPQQRFGGCNKSCCREAHVAANRSQSTSMLSIKSRVADRRHLLYSMQRRTVSEGHATIKS